MLSGIQPSGDLHLGNYVGAISRWAREQQPEHFFCIVNLHAITVPQDPAGLRERTVDLACWLLAAGLDPDVCTLFVQSHVAEHAELSWVLECTATMGELGRMVQFKEKSAGKESVSVGLFTYPVLQAADILLYQADEVPVGADQRQHVELTRDLAQRFNTRFGDTFTLPRATLPEAGARVMDLQLVDKRMAKSVESPQGKILLGESEDETRRKVMRAVTDSGAEVRAAADKPGVSNLLDLMAAVTGTDIAALEAHFDGKGYGDFKREVAEAVNAYLRPVRSRYAELRTDPAMVEESLRKGAGKARAVAAETMEAVRDRVGLLPRA
ncbi:MAG: tryptophan--tRNA ligase [Euzebyaceae bacterium]|nr:tryptophan--tRNA ligase [Euzebyaceae bacterium]